MYLRHFGSDVFFARCNNYLKEGKWFGVNFWKLELNWKKAVRHRNHRSKYLKLNQKTKLRNYKEFGNYHIWVQCCISYRNQPFDLHSKMKWLVSIWNTTRGRNMLNTIWNETLDFKLLVEIELLTSSVKLLNEWNEWMNEWMDGWIKTLLNVE